MFLQFNHRKHAKNTILMSMFLVVKLQPGLHIQQYKKILELEKKFSS